jgi:ADP-ribose pyrophosphatase YjhB (NUDIX family)
MTPTVAVGAIVFDGTGRVLVIRRGTPPGEGQWTVPGGHLEEGETIAAGIAREVAEETGLVIEVGPLVEIVERIGEGYHFVIHDHLARVIGGELAAATDAQDARFVTADELAQLHTTDGLVPVIDRARAKNGAWSPISR